MRKSNDERILRWIYRRLLKTFGKRHWWPAESPFEVIVGAILTQGTNWSNVEKSIRILKQKRMMGVGRLSRLPTKKLAEAIRPSGFFKVKAARLKHFLRFLNRRWKGSLNRMFQHPTPDLREELLSVPGIGKETADSILLYAGGKPVFVVDAYTRRILSRHGLVPNDASYDAIQHFFSTSLPKRASLFNEYHALLVEVGKRYCRTTPQCAECPLDPLPRRRQECLSFARTLEGRED